jgi:anti-anti-sigma factor
MITQLPLLSSPLPVSVLNQIPLVQLPPSLSMAEAIALKETCQQLWRQAPTRIVLDCSQTTFVDSSGIGSLVSSVKTSWEQGIELVLWSVHPQVMQTLFRVGLGPFLVVDLNTQVTPSSPPRRVSLRALRPRPMPYHPSVCSRLKRLIDITGAVVGLGITGVLLIPIAIAIQLDSPGPVLFCQTRCGLFGHRFRLWKFRSMVTNAEALKAQIKNEVEGPFFKNQNDPRITRVGRFCGAPAWMNCPSFGMFWWET